MNLFRKPLCHSFVSVCRLLVALGLILLSVAPVSAQAIYKQLRAFGFVDLSSTLPEAPLIEGTNGVLYGTSFGGGQNQNGTLFKLNKNGSGFLIIHSFTGTNGDGSNPGGPGLLMATNGILYGTTASGGSSNFGTLFRIDPGGSNYSVIKSFTGVSGDGKFPHGLIEASNGALYGVTSSGGDFNLGTVYRINADGGGYAIVKSFAGGNTDGGQPFAPLLQATNGMLFGTTYAGGASNLGAIYTLNLDGSGYQVLRSFAGRPNDGAHPYASLTSGPDGKLYGTTAAGGISNSGTAFRLNQDGGSYESLKSFTGSDGTNLVAPLIFGTNGMLYGTASNGGQSANGTIFRFHPDGSGFQVIKTYAQNISQGASPVGPLLQASDGALYGTTSYGGTGSLAPNGGGQGTAFFLKLDGSAYTVIWNFSNSGGDGIAPNAPLTEAAHGWLYGVTQNGGAYGQGTVFKLREDGSGYTLMRSFAGTKGNTALSDGALPYAGLVKGTDGALYGTTTADESANLTYYTVVSGNGTIFKINPDGTGYQVLKRFTGGNDGKNPYGGLIQASDGALYGTTWQGGARGEGTIFKLNIDGTSFTVLTNFNPATGTECLAALLQGSDGALYGTTVAGGTVFKLNTDGTGYRVLKSFSSASEGSFLRAPLIQGFDGFLYGTAAFGGGSYNAGTVFKLSTNGTDFSVLRRFTGINGDGRLPQGSLVQGRNGILYGTTSAGGADPIGQGAGTVFQLNPDGSGFAILRSFFQDFYDGASPDAGLIQGSDGTLFGTTSTGGLGAGTVYNLVPPAVVLKPVPSGAGWHISFLGIPDRMYTLQKATVVSGPWCDLANVLVDSNGLGEFEDLDPLAYNAVYRTMTH